MIGQSLPRLEDGRFVTGNGRYTDDIQIEGQLYAAFLRSPHAHARLGGIDIAEARAGLGVIAVMTGQDYLDAGFQGIDHHPNPTDAVHYTEASFANSLTGSIFAQRHLPLAVDKVRHVGEPVVMVIAQTALQARDAAELVSVDYEVLEAVVRIEDAMRPGAPQLWGGALGNVCFTVDSGDRAAVQEIFSNAAHVVRREFLNSRTVNSQMEPRAAIGLVDQDTGVYTIISGSQGALRVKQSIANALMVPAEKVRAISPDVGGGFGARTPMYVEQLAVVWAALTVGRPVKWTGDRSEAFLSDYQGRDALMRAAMALNSDGKILAIEHEWIGNAGAHAISYVSMSNGPRVLSSVYHVPAIVSRVSAVVSNTVPTAPYRGAGRPEAMHVMERLLDIAAREMNIDRVEIRRRNVISRDRLPYLTPTGQTYECGDFAANMERVLEMADWNGFPARREASRARGMLRGIGMANYLEAPVGIPRERIEMTVQPDGVIDIIAGTLSQGQGHETTFAQVVAHYLGVPVGAIRLRTGDTDFVRGGGGTHSDRSMRLGGTLLVRASTWIIEAAQAAAAEMLDTPDVKFEGGAYRDAASGRSADLFAVAHYIAGHGMPHERSIRSLARTEEFVGRIPAHPTGAVVCELEVDPETGTVTLLDYSSVDDVGRPINPMIVDGQIHGGLAQGIGQALSEGCYVDTGTGQVLSGSYMDYGVPRAGAVPALRIELTEDPTALNPLGVKGGGESGITPATAVIFNALGDALRDYGSDELAMPAVAAVVWQYIHRASPNN